MGDVVRVRHEGPVAVIGLYRAEKRNALRYADLLELYRLVGTLGTDGRTRAIVLHGDGGSFCTGIDAAELHERDPEQAVDVGWGGARSGWFLLDCPLPVVAAVDGYAVGMGAELACQADLRIASPAARFGWNFPRVGLVPDMGVSTLLLPHIVGLPAALDLLTSGRTLAAAEAHALGYVTELVDQAATPSDTVRSDDPGTTPSDTVRSDDPGAVSAGGATNALVARAVELAGRMAAGSPFAAGRIKALTYAALADPAGHLVRHERALAECLASDDHHEGIAAFLQRRPARFTGH